MFKMVSEYGNVVFYVDTEREKENFERLGFKEEESEKKEAKSNTESTPITRKRGSKVNERAKY